MRILFLGSGEMSQPTLEFLLNRTGCQVVAVITQPDRPVGRKMTVQPSPIKLMARAKDIPVLQPRRLRDEVASLQIYRPDIAVAISYGQILSNDMLSLPVHGCINVHTSLLPRHRGASPVQSAILSGDSETGISIMQMEAGLDTGPVMHVQRTPIQPNDTGGSLYNRLAELAPACVDQVLTHLQTQGQLPAAITQDHSLATHCGKLTREHGHLNWQQCPESIERQVRAYSPWPGTFGLLKGKVIKIHAVQVAATTETGQPAGTILSADTQDGLRIACQGGVVLIRELQEEGRKRLPAEAYLAGHSMQIGSRFE